MWAVFSCVLTLEWLPALVIFNAHADTDACDCPKHCKRVCPEKWLQEKKSPAVPGNLTLTLYQLSQIHPRRKQSTVSLFNNKACVTRQHVDFFIDFLNLFTPSLPEPVKRPGWKMHRRTSKQYIFWSYSNLFSSLCILMEILSHASAKMKAKRLTGFKFRRFYESFSNDMAEKGLIGVTGKFLLRQHSFIFKHSKNRKKKYVLIISPLGICS